MMNEDATSKQYTYENRNPLMSDLFHVDTKRTRPDTRQSSRGRLGRSSNAKTNRNSEM